MIKLVSEFFALALIIFIIVRYVVPRVAPLLAKQQEVIDKQVADAEEARSKLAEAERSYQNAVTDARTESAQIRENARGEAQRTVEDLKTLAAEESERIIARGEAQLANQRASIVRELRAEIGSLATDLSKLIVEQRLSDESQVSATVDSLITELESRAGTGASTTGGDA